MVDFAAHMANLIRRVGQPVTVTPSGQAARVVNAVFSANQGEAFGIIGGSRLQLRASSVDVDGMKPGDPVTIGARNYTVASVDDDLSDAGDCLIHLESV